jgi:3-oxoadipyl-CoA thiolase
LLRGLDRVSAERADHLGSVEQSLSLRGSGAVLDVRIVEDLGQRSATLVLADHVGGDPILARRPGEEKRERVAEEVADGHALRFYAGFVSRAVVLVAVRTPVGRYGGALSHIRPDDLAARAISAAVERAGIEPSEIEDVYFGAANQAGEDNRNVARMGGLLAGLPESVAGVTLNRLCASGLSAVVSACHAVAAGDGELFVAGGVESMSRAPLVMGKPDKAFPRGDQVVYDTTLGWRFPNPRMAEMFPLESMGETGENVAERWGVSREEQDEFALRSQQRWAAADFSDELVAVDGVDRDEHPRPDTTQEKLATLKPAFRADGSVTAGNSSGINDGAAALVIAGEEKARALGVEPLAAFVGSAVAGVDPRVMGIGPVPAVQKLLARTGIGAGDIDLVELNEAFASQSLVVIRELGLDPEKVNVNGGAIAIGHPLGMSGARLVVTLLHELRRRNGRYGLATLCVGVGQGQAALFER